MNACVLLAQNGNAAQPGWNSLLGPLFPFLMIAVLFYFLMIRPEHRKRTELAAMLQNLEEKRPGGDDRRHLRHDRQRPAGFG